MLQSRDVGREESRDYTRVEKHSSTDSMTSFQTTCRPQNCGLDPILSAPIAGSRRCKEEGRGRVTYENCSCIYCPNLSLRIAASAQSISKTVALAHVTIPKLELILQPQSARPRLQWNGRAKGMYRTWHECEGATCVLTALKYIERTNEKSWRKTGSNCSSQSLGRGVDRVYNALPYHFRLVSDMLLDTTEIFKDGTKRVLATGGVHRYVSQGPQCGCWRTWRSAANCLGGWRAEAGHSELCPEPLVFQHLATWYSFPFIDILWYTIWPPLMFFLCVPEEGTNHDLRCNGDHRRPESLVVWLGDNVKAENVALKENPIMWDFCWNPSIEMYITTSVELAVGS